MSAMQQKRSRTGKKTPKTRKRHRQESAKQQKVVNISNLQKKTMKSIVKPPQKIRQSSKYTCNAKIQTIKQAHVQIIVQYTCVNRMQKAKIQQ